MLRRSTVQRMPPRRPLGDVAVLVAVCRDTAGACAGTVGALGNHSAHTDDGFDAVPDATSTNSWRTVSWRGVPVADRAFSEVTVRQILSSRWSCVRADVRSVATHLTSRFHAHIDFQRNVETTSQVALVPRLAYGFVGTFAAIGCDVYGSDEAADGEVI